MKPEGFFKSCSTCISRRKGFCSYLDDESLHRLACANTHPIFKSKQALQTAGKIYNYVSVLICGFVKAYTDLPDGREQVIAFAAPGHMWGMALPGVARTPNDYNIEAIGDVQICHMPMQPLEDIIEKNGTLTRFQERLMLGEMRDMRKHATLLGQKSAIERVASFLIEMYRLQTTEMQKSAIAQLKGTNAQTRIFLPMTRTDIADYLGLTLETVSRTFGAFRKKGLITSQGRQYVWTSIAKLGELSGDEP